MDTTTEELAAVIGARVRHERQARGWTLDRLAERSGVSRRTLVHVEQGSANPSVGSLLRLGDALGVALPALVAAPEPSAVRMTRRGEGAVLWTGDAGGRGELVASSSRPEVAELWAWTLEPGEQHASDAHAPGTRELLQVQEGALQVQADGGTFLLDAGDAMAFPGDAAHSYAQRGDGRTRFSLAVVEPRPQRPAEQPGA